MCKIKDKKNNKYKSGLSPNAMTIIFFVLPSILGCIIFIYLPSLISFILSFCNWNLINDIRYSGLENYNELIFSEEFWLILKNTIIYALSITFFGTIIPIIAAAILYEKVICKDFLKTAYFMPFITPMIAIAMIWQWIFDPNIGLVNTIIKTNLNWLYSSDLAMIVLIIVSVWKLIGYNIIIFLSGFSSINKDVYDAAKIDGAGVFYTFLKITLPLLSPTILFVLLITTISSFQVFDLIYLMTQGGPENSTNVLVYWLYKNAFEFFNIGKASAIAYILFTIILILTIIQWKSKHKWVINE